jgi:4-hydroxy-tetrahydrodipicolinate synthase
LAQGAEARFSTFSSSLSTLNSPFIMLFTGTGVAIVTPFKTDKSVDFEALRRIVNHCIDGQVDYIVVLGTTGESVTLSAGEKADVVRCVVDATAGRVQIVVGAGGNNTAKLVETVEQTNFDGISGLLSVAPYYNKPAQAGLVEHFKAVAAASPVPVILYNVPGRTGVNMTAETTLTLAHEVDNIVAIKEASGMLPQMMQIIKDRPNNFSVISGDDAISLPLIALGGQGVISVVANAFPHKISAIIRQALAGNCAAAQATHYAILHLFEAIFAEGNPSGIKAALSILGLSQNVLRLPLVPVSPKTYTQLELLIQQSKA